jgi:hypothetical protein
LIRASALIVFSALFVVGCETPPKFDWVNSNATVAQKENTLADCEYQIKLNKTPPGQQQDLRNLCMRGKGFRWQRVG